MLPLVSTNTMPAFEPELTMPYRVLLGRSPLGMGPNRRELPLYVTLYTLTMTTLPLTSYVMPDWSVATFDSESWDTESLVQDRKRCSDVLLDASPQCDAACIVIG